MLSHLPQHNEAELESLELLELLELLALPRFRFESNSWPQISQKQISQRSAILHSSSHLQQHAL